MSPTVAKALMTGLAGAATTAALLPQLSPYQSAFTALAGLLAGWAHGPQPGTAAIKEQARAATSALARSIEGER